ncbi:hypothetical protein EG68_03301 [Paragonimus skrjabini miyazakii]|uniref:Uncharacterized protein n=1 Tax=Paragonimus skrjabini miyazakii TaxID=59628 RepID=A0A8S9YXF2_9TREM|nr:hypothetical protein EG68_03301 [Paragonimus skrjabini miyazakii]
MEKAKVSKHPTDQSAMEMLLGHKCSGACCTGIPHRRKVVPISQPETNVHTDTTPCEPEAHKATCRSGESTNDRSSVLMNAASVKMKQRMSGKQNFQKPMQGPLCVTSTKDQVTKSVRSPNAVNSHTTEGSPFPPSSTHDVGSINLSGHQKVTSLKEHIETEADLRLNRKKYSAEIPMETEGNEPKKQAATSQFRHVRYLLETEYPSLSELTMAMPSLKALLLDRTLQQNCPAELIDCIKSLVNRLQRVVARPTSQKQFTITQEERASLRRALLLANLMESPEVKYNGSSQRKQHSIDKNGNSQGTFSLSAVQEHVSNVRDELLDALSSDKIPLSGYRRLRKQLVSLSETISLSASHNPLTILKAPSTLKNDIDRLIETADNKFVQTDEVEMDHLLQECFNNLILRLQPLVTAFDPQLIDVGLDGIYKAAQYSENAHLDCIQLNRNTATPILNALEMACREHELNPILKSTESMQPKNLWSVASHLTQRIEFEVTNERKDSVTTCTILELKEAVLIQHILLTVLAASGFIRTNAEKLKDSRFHSFCTKQSSAFSHGKTESRSTEALSPITEICTPDTSTYESEFNRTDSANDSQSPIVCVFQPNIAYQTLKTGPVTQSVEDEQTSTRSGYTNQTVSMSDINKKDIHMVDQIPTLCTSGMLQNDNDQTVKSTASSSSTVYIQRTLALPIATFLRNKELDSISRQIKCGEPESVSQGIAALSSNLDKKLKGTGENYITLSLEEFKKIQQMFLEENTPYSRILYRSLDKCVHDGEKSISPCESTRNIEKTNQHSNCVTSDHRLKCLIDKVETKMNRNLSVSDVNEIVEVLAQLKPILSEADSLQVRNLISDIQSQTKTFRVTPTVVNKLKYLINVCEHSEKHTTTSPSANYLDSYDHSRQTEFLTTKSDTSTFKINGESGSKLGDRLPASRTVRPSTCLCEILLAMFTLKSVLSVVKMYSEVPLDFSQEQMNIIDTSLKTLKQSYPRICTVLNKCTPVTLRRVQMWSLIESSIKEIEQCVEFRNDFENILRTIEQFCHETNAPIHSETKILLKTILSSALIICCYSRLSLKEADIMATLELIQKATSQADFRLDKSDEFVLANLLQTLDNKTYAGHEKVEYATRVDKPTFQDSNPWCHLSKWIHHIIFHNTGQLDSETAFKNARILRTLAGFTGSEELHIEECSCVACRDRLSEMRQYDLGKEARITSERLTTVEEKPTNQEHTCDISYQANGQQIVGNDLSTGDRVVQEVYSKANNRFRGSQFSNYTQPQESVELLDVALYMQCLISSLQHSLESDNSVKLTPAECANLSTCLLTITEQSPKLEEDCSVLCVIQETKTAAVNHNEFYLTKEHLHSLKQLYEATKTVTSCSTQQEIEVGLSDTKEHWMVSPQSLEKLLVRYTCEQPINMRFLPLLQRLTQLQTELNCTEPADKSVLVSEVEELAAKLHSPNHVSAEELPTFDHEDKLVAIKQLHSMQKRLRESSSGGKPLTSPEKKYCTILINQVAMHSTKVGATKKLQISEPMVVELVRAHKTSDEVDLNVTKLLTDHIVYCLKEFENNIVMDDASLDESIKTSFFKPAVHQVSADLSAPSESLQSGQLVKSQQDSSVSMSHPLTSSVYARQVPKQIPRKMLRGSTEPTTVKTSIALMCLNLLELTEQTSKELADFERVSTDVERTNLFENVSQMLELAQELHLPNAEHLANFVHEMGFGSSLPTLNCFQFHINETKQLLFDKMSDLLNFGQIILDRSYKSIDEQSESLDIIRSSTPLSISSKNAASVRFTSASEPLADPDRIQLAEALSLAVLSEESRTPWKMKAIVGLIQKLRSQSGTLSLSEKEVELANSTLCSTAVSVRSQETGMENTGPVAVVTRKTCFTAFKMPETNVLTPIESAELSGHIFSALQNDSVRKKLTCEQKTYLLQIERGLFCAAVEGESTNIAELTNESKEQPQSILQLLSQLLSEDDARLREHLIDRLDFFQAYVLESKPAGDSVDRHEHSATQRLDSRTTEMLHGCLLSELRTNPPNLSVMLPLLAIVSELVASKDTAVSMEQLSETEKHAIQCYIPIDMTHFELQTVSNFLQSTSVLASTLSEQLAALIFIQRTMDGESLWPMESGLLLGALETIATANDTARKQLLYDLEPLKRRLVEHAFTQNDMDDVYEGRGLELTHAECNQLRLLHRTTEISLTRKSREFIQSVLAQPPSSTAPNTTTLEVCQIILHYLLRQRSLSMEESVKLDVRSRALISIACNHYRMALKDTSKSWVDRFYTALEEEALDSGDVISQRPLDIVNTLSIVLSSPAAYNLSPYKAGFLAAIVDKVYANAIEINFTPDELNLIDEIGRDADQSDNPKGISSNTVDLSICLKVVEDFLDHIWQEETTPINLDRRDAAELNAALETLVRMTDQHSYCQSWDSDDTTVISSECRAILGMTRTFLNSLLTMRSLPNNSELQTNNLVLSNVEVGKLRELVDYWRSRLLLESQRLRTASIRKLSISMECDLTADMTNAELANAVQLAVIHDQLLLPQDAWMCIQTLEQLSDSPAAEYISIPNSQREVLRLAMCPSRANVSFTPMDASLISATTYLHTLFNSSSMAANSDSTFGSCVEPSYVAALAVSLHSCVQHMSGESMLPAVKSQLRTTEHRMRCASARLETYWISPLESSAVLEVVQQARAMTGTWVEHELNDVMRVIDAANEGVLTAHETSIDPNQQQTLLQLLRTYLILGGPLSQQRYTALVRLIDYLQYTRPACISFRQRAEIQQLIQLFVPNQSPRLSTRFHFSMVCSNLQSLTSQDSLSRGGLTAVPLQINPREALFLLNLLHQLNAATGVVTPELAIIQSALSYSIAIGQPWSMWNMLQDETKERILAQLELSAETLLNQIAETENADLLEETTVNLLELFLKKMFELVRNRDPTISILCIMKFISSLLPTEIRLTESRKLRRIAHVDQESGEQSEGISPTNELLSVLVQAKQEIEENGGLVQADTIANILKRIDHLRRRESELELNESLKNSLYEAQNELIQLTLTTAKLCRSATDGHWEIQYSQPFQSNSLEHLMFHLKRIDDQTISGCEPTIRLEVLDEKQSHSEFKISDWHDLHECIKKNQLQTAPYLSPTLAHEDIDGVSSEFERLLTLCKPRVLDPSEVVQLIALIDSLHKKLHQKRDGISDCHELTATEKLLLQELRNAADQKICYSLSLQSADLLQTLGYRLATMTTQYQQELLRRGLQLWLSASIEGKFTFDRTETHNLHSALLLARNAIRHKRMTASSDALEMVDKVIEQFSSTVDSGLGTELTGPYIMGPMVTEVLEGAQRAQELISLPGSTLSGAPSSASDWCDSCKIDGQGQQNQCWSSTGLMLNDTEDVSEQLNTDQTLPLFSDAHQSEKTNDSTENNSPAPRATTSHQMQVDRHRGHSNRGFSEPRDRIVSHSEGPANRKQTSVQFPDISASLLTEINEEQKRLKTWEKLVETRLTNACTRVENLLGKISVESDESGSQEKEHVKERNEELNRLRDEVIRLKGQLMHVVQQLESAERTQQRQIDFASSMHDLMEQQKQLTVQLMSARSHQLSSRGQPSRTLPAESVQGHTGRLYQSSDCLKDFIPPLKSQSHQSQLVLYKPIEAEPLDLSLSSTRPNRMSSLDRLHELIEIRRAVVAGSREELCRLGVYSSLPLTSPRNPIYHHPPVSITTIGTKDRSCPRLIHSLLERQRAHTKHLLKRSTYEQDQNSKVLDALEQRLVNLEQQISPSDCLSSSEPTEDINSKLKK